MYLGFFIPCELIKPASNGGKSMDRDFAKGFELKQLTSLYLRAILTEPGDVIAEVLRLRRCTAAARRS